MFVLVISATAMGVIGLCVKKLKMKWLETYALAISMFVAMAGACLLANVIN